MRLVKNGEGEEETQRDNPPGQGPWPPQTQQLAADSRQRAPLLGAANIDKKTFISQPDLFVLLTVQTVITSGAARKL